MTFGTFVQLAMAVACAIPCFVMSARLGKVWRDPLSMDEGKWVNRGVGIFIMEFILLHAGVFIGSTMANTEELGLRLLALGGLLLFYGLFAGALALAFKSRELLLSFLWLIGGRFVAILLGASQQDAQLIGAYSVVGFMLYLTMVFASVFLPFPRLGVTDEIARRFRLPNSSGLWVDQPHRAIGAATVYYFLLGLAELAILSWIDPERIMPN